MSICNKSPLKGLKVIRKRTYSINKQAVISSVIKDTKGQLLRLLFFFTMVTPTKAGLMGVIKHREKKRNCQALKLRSDVLLEGN